MIDALPGATVSELKTVFQLITQPANSGNRLYGAVQGNRTWNATAHFATARGFAAGQTQPQALKFDHRQTLGGWKNPSAIPLWRSCRRESLATLQSRFGMEPSRFATDVAPARLFDVSSFRLAYSCLACDRLLS